MIQKLNAGFRKIPAWVLYLLLPLPGIYTFYLGLTNNLGPEPIHALESQLGELALKLLIVGLAITPLLKFAQINLIKFRRAIGVMAFAYVAAHLLVWLVLDVGILSQIVDDILKRRFIMVGMLAFVLMIPLAITSNNWSVRRLGPKWRRLHRLTYGVAVLGGLHFIMQAKGFQIEPLVYMAVILAFLAVRIPQWRKEWARSKG